MKVISRNQAIILGLKRYFSNEPCAHGHIAERMVSNCGCIKCIRISADKYAKKYPQKYRRKRRLYEKAWYARNPEKRKRRNKLKNLRQKKKNPQKFKDRNRISNSNRRARKRCNGGSHTLSDIKMLLDKQKNKCAFCFVRFEKTGYHIDHFVAIVNGGTNDITNIQLLCPSCNISKAAKDPFVFANENGRLL